MHDIVVEVPFPGVRDEDEAVARVSEAGLQAASNGSGYVVARDDRIAVMQDPRHRPWHPALGSCEMSEERVERMAAGILDRDGVEPRAHVSIDARQGRARFGGEGVVDGRLVLGGR